MDTNIAVSLARQLMIDHGLGHWSFEFDRAKRRAGCCKHRSSIISLSYVYTTRNSEPEVKDTILHEIAHALAGPKQGHNNVWKTICRRIGAKPVRCYSADTVDMPKGRWKAQCNSCKKEFHAHRRPKNHMNRYCTRCGPVNGAITFKQGY
jgi:predicted SprT family Zn-dependent metalloprotease